MNKQTNDEGLHGSPTFGNEMLPAVFRPKDRIVWDSGHGYEIGYFLSENGVMHNTYLVDIITGICIGEVSHSINQIKPYSKELIKELTAKYGYEKRLVRGFLNQPKNTPNEPTT